MYPHIKETTKDALVISVGQLSMREWLPEFTDFSPETSEVIGAISMAAGAINFTGSWRKTY